MVRIRILFVLLVTALLTGCYNRRTTAVAPSIQYTNQQIDSIVFAYTHHYTENFNFVVRADSLWLTRQTPEEWVSQLPVDSFAVPRNTRLVVADIRILPTDSIDSVWVQLAQDQATFGWIHESQLLSRVDPDDPISQFISFFSNKHLLIFLVMVIVIVVGYSLRLLLRRNAHIVHLRDIDTFYPTLLALLVAVSATLYSTIQLFAPDAWREFYFHPTLNPFRQSGLLFFFLTSVWAMVIVSLAAVDDTLRHLHLGEAMLYLLGLAGLCALNYVIFSLTTLYYVGYVLLVAYIVFAFYRYFHVTRSKYLCGHCGMQIHRKGVCPHCGAVNK